MDYYGGRFNGGNEKSLYQPGHKKPKHKSPNKNNDNEYHKSIDAKQKRDDRKYVLSVATTTV